HGQELPKLEWAFPDGPKAEISLSVNQPAKSIRLWMANSDDRDFRNDQWFSRPLEIKSGSSKANAVVDTPQKGYRAFLAEVVLKSPTGQDYKLSTEARVTPDNVK